ncbi:MAG: ChbG/HpnK family deacetylase [Lachnospiraceae bacterium]|nr:ChbG/HpnK family deacetylase [Lachnospiraceae bacterium]
MIRAIVNGDDFGINENVNRAITECFERRILTGTTLMVNMPRAREAAELAHRYGFAEMVGLHLNLTSGRPLTTPIRSCRRFCRKGGRFNAYFQQHTLTRLSISRREREAVAIEIEAQIRRYLSFGLPERHLDSHHHVHTDRSIMRELMPLLMKYNFHSIRLTRNLFQQMGFLKRVYKKNFNGNLKKSGLITTDYFGSYQDLLQMGDELPDNALVEIMLHPMYGPNGRLMDTKTPISEVSLLLASLNAELQAYPVVKDD